ncbi:HXXEE domain-containing protein [Vagococcus hydrophili]|uniref:HXXEE domain-containing protein n=1 Tax=Vagococcus hydrophili TaxID=2714947 RepID=A0A6G8AUQ7_9ENTE|nr:HXXEE domain-containing protein [Vagococcus hydrophili]QIL48736.1 HXXEE domain-containing protein [Vagococcus hydrophili]
MNHSILFLYLSFPILFMLHELEEIAYMNDWLHKNLKSEKIPQRLKKNPPTHKAFTLMVLEEYLLMLVIAVICYSFSYHEFYVSLIIAYNIHILVHIGQALFFEKLRSGINIRDILFYYSHPYSIEKCFRP